MASRVLSRRQVREFDRLAIQQFEMPSLVLMENAARAACDVLEQQTGERSAVILCGPGNNGGDGLVMARHLHLRGWRTKVLMLAESGKLSPDAEANRRILSHTRVPVLAAAGFSDSRLETGIANHAWIVDALLGTGAQPPLRSPMNEFVEIANRQAARRMAVDIPSGLDCDADTPQAAGGTIFRAHLTVSFVALKPVMLTDTGKRYCGEIRIVDIGAPPEIFGLVED
jgi:NAD(P)H-hydrate epimerase